MKIIGETFFVDTNIFVAVTDRSRSSHSAAIRLFNEMPGTGAHLAWSGQVVREYLVVATRPRERNGLGLSTELALKNVDLLSKRLVLIDESTQTNLILKSLVAKHSLSGKRIHDANIAATMVAGGLTHLISDDTTDYRVFSAIQTFSTADLNQIL
ncbi:MAG: PIN domain-containing protein [Candidatus Eremiobacteraeota bacterium]|nr:PIN domain-containing protein [Candidatus Eremiobacteraeota bacterium]